MKSRNVGRMLFAGLVIAVGMTQATAAEPKKDTKDKAIREAGPAECDRQYPDKALCPPKSLPEERRCDVLAADIAGVSGRTGYSFEQKKMDMRKQYQLMCASSKGSEFECEHLGRDLAGSTGTKGYTAEVRKGDLRWIYERRCTGGRATPAAVPAITIK